MSKSFKATEMRYTVGDKVVIKEGLERSMYVAPFLVCSEVAESSGKVATITNIVNSGRCSYYDIDGGTLCFCTDDMIDPEATELHRMYNERITTAIAVDSAGVSIGNINTDTEINVTVESFFVSGTVRIGKYEINAYDGGMVITEVEGE